MARKRKGRPVNGILVLDKPSGITSNKALQKVKHLFNAQKAGHTGSLDPLATGVLPICLGEATKISHYLLDANKTYRAKCVLGTITTTGDSDGEILVQKTVDELSKKELLELLSGFEGAQQQTPPMYSALKHNGRPLYEYARKGIVIERKSRPVTIFNITLLDYSFVSQASDSQGVSTQAFIEIEVQCSKGTYIRTLCEDIGEKLGCGAHISALRRIDSEPFSLSQAISLEQLLSQFRSDSPDDKPDFEAMDQILLTTDFAIQQFPAVHINKDQLHKIQHGMTIEVQPEIDASDYRLYYDDTLIALAVLDDHSNLKPKRLLFL